MENTVAELSEAVVREELLNALRLHPHHTVSEEQIQLAIRMRHQDHTLTADVWRRTCQKAISDGDVIRLPAGKLSLPK